MIFGLFLNKQLFQNLYSMYLWKYNVGCYDHFDSGHNLKPMCCCQCDGFHPQRNNFQTFNYTEKIAISKFLSWFLRIDGHGKGLIALQSLLAIKKDTRIFCRVFYGNKWPSQNFYQAHFRKIRVGGGYPPSYFLESSKRVLKLQTTSSISPFKVFTTAFSIKILSIIIQIYKYINLSINQCLSAFRDCHPERHNFWTLQLRWTKWLSQNFVGMYLEKWWAQEGVSWSPFAFGF